MSEVAIPFAFRGHDCQLKVSISDNAEPQGIGCDLLATSLPPDAAAGFPVCIARPEMDLAGYAAACGWIQVVRSTDASDDFEMDPLAVFRDVDTPFAFFGIAPVLFDAPFRSSRYDMAWQARSFLAAIPDGVMSKVVQPIAAFQWGFSVLAGAISIDEPAPLDLRRWDDHLALFAHVHPRWTFAASGVATASNGG